MQYRFKNFKIPRKVKNIPKKNAAFIPRYQFRPHQQSESLLSGHPWLHFPHGRYFIIKCGSLSVSVHTPNMLYPFISVTSNFLYNWVNFKL